MPKQGSALVIEDDHDSRVALRAGLEAAGFYVVSATNGARALELLEAITLPNVILLDLSMPIMNGDDFLKIVATKPSWNSIPIVQMSDLHALREGACCAVSKPVVIEELLQAIQKCTGQTEF